MIEATKKVKEAKTPREAIIILANCIDALDRIVRASENDGWDTPTDFTTPEAELEQRGPVETAVLINALEERLANPSLDGEDRRAIEAQLYLLRDEGESLPEPDQGERSVIELKGNEVIIHLPPASQERQDARRKLAESLQLDEALPIEGASATDAFAKGGPLWLYYAARDYAASLPEDVRRALVNDVIEDSPAEAHEIARDLLKDTDPGNHEITIENLNNVRDN